MRDLFTAPIRSRPKVDLREGMTGSLSDGVTLVFTGSLPYDWRIIDSLSIFRPS